MPVNRNYNRQQLLNRQLQERRRQAEQESFNSRIREQQLRQSETEELQRQQSQAEQERINRINRVIKRSFEKGSVGNEFSLLSREDRQFVTEKIKELEDSGEFSQKVKQGFVSPSRFNQSVSPILQSPPQEVPSSTFQGPIQEGYSEIQFRETGKQVPLTRGPIQPERSEIVFRELNKNVPISEELKYFTSSQIKSEPPIINQLNPIQKANVFFDRTLPNIIKDTKQDIREQGLLGYSKNVLKASQLQYLKRFTKTPTKEEYLGIFFLPAFMSGTQSASVQESGYYFDAVTGRYLTKAQYNKLLQQRLSNLLQQGIDRIVIDGKTINLRELTRDLVSKNLDNPSALKRLRNYYKSVGRLELFEDILRQESPIISRAIPKIPSTIEATGSIVGNVASYKPSESIFSGTGQYERTSEVQPIGPFGTFSESQGVKSLGASVLSSSQAQNQIQGPQTIFTPTTQFQTRTQTQQRGGLLFGFDLQQKQKQRQGQSFLFRERLREEERTRTKQQSQQLQKQPLLTKTLLRTLSKLRKAKDDRKNVVYDLLIGKSGNRKEYVIKLGQPKYKATKKGLGIIDSDISASFKLINPRLSKKKDIDRFGLPSKFRFGKNDKNRIVEKARFRLDTGRERSEIQAFKRRKGKLF